MAKQKKLMLLGGIRYLLPAIEAAHKHNIHVITVDYLPENIAHKYSDEYHNVSILDKDAVLHLAEELKIDGILSYAVDPGVVTAAYVAEKMNLPFTCSYEAACILQDKSKFRKFLSDNGFDVPHAKGYTKDEVDIALSDKDFFTWPVIVKPVDSAGSKGVSRVDNPQNILDAINIALLESHNGHFIIEDFLELNGYQSSADCFSLDGKLIYADYSDQLFDNNAANPYTPSIEIWPSSMFESIQEKLSSELQRLIELLGMGTGLYNVESRFSTNGKAYLMEVSPRAGGNRIAELQRIGTGIDLIEAEVCKAVRIKIPSITQPRYNGVYVNDIIHSDKAGLFCGITYNSDFKKKFVLNEAIYPKIGEKIEIFRGANNAVGSIFLKFSNRSEADKYLRNLSDNIIIKVK
ncbi:ATP-grasp domain-containing protein [Segatella bryantii]|uniref:ATP-grasp domain-containing protein n=1 Tax=Segatella bryantii TaxID=77095 RepID=UPI00241C569D|nr:ATP-grasp domain-containing protein [Segatella bryantii]